MARLNSLAGLARGVLQSSLTGVLVVTLAAEPALAAQAAPLQSAPTQTAPVQASPAQAAAAGAVGLVHGKLTDDQKVLHLLNRLTFGPTPQSIAEATKLGLNRWMEQQLDMSSVDESQLEAKLADYPAMSLDPDELIARFPTNNVMRQIVSGKLTIPPDKRLAAVYEHRLQLFEEKRDTAKGGKTVAAAPMVTAGAGQAGMTGQAGMPAMTEEARMTSSAPEASPGQQQEVAEQAGASEAPARRLGARPVYSSLLAEGVLELTPTERLDRVLSMEPHEYEDFKAGLRPQDRQRLLAGMTPQQRELLGAFDAPVKAVSEELMSQRLLRDIYSKHQLQEVMTTFWLNHFNVYLRKNEETPYYISSYEQDAIQPNALGKFEDLLVAVAHSPAMLIYLDNNVSTGPNSKASETHRMRQETGQEPKGALPGLNENYARELMELHTLGVNGGYTQQDVTEVAKIFSGWTVDHPGLGGGFLFDASRHEPGPKVVMGRTYKDEGQKEGLKLLHELATSPATANFISHELAVEFVSDNPPASLVKKMARSFHDSDGDIARVLWTMVHAPEFWSPEVYQAKVKSPLEYVVSAVRAGGADVVNPMPLENQLNRMGMPLYGAQPPTGYLDKAEDWMSTGELVNRMNFAVELASGRLPGTFEDWSLNGGGEGAPGLVDPAVEEANLAARILPGGVSEQTRRAALNELTAKLPLPQVRPATARARMAEAREIEARRGRVDATLAGLLLGSPEFQRR